MSKIEFSSYKKITVCKCGWFANPERMDLSYMFNSMRTFCPCCGEEFNDISGHNTRTKLGRFKWEHYNGGFLGLYKKKKLIGFVEKGQEDTYWPVKCDYENM
jgi:hypothetical protein